MALSVAQLYEVMAQLPDPVFILSEDGYYIEYIGGMEQQSYQNGNPLIGRQLLDVLPEDKAQWVMAQVAQALASGQVQVVEYDLSPAEVDGIDADAGPQGMQRFEGKIAPLPSLYEGKRAVTWMTRSITRQHELQQRLKRLGETDQLTGLYNRHFFFDQYHHRVQGQHLTGLIMLISITSSRSTIASATRPVTRSCAGSASASPPSCGGRISSCAAVARSF